MYLATMWLVLRRNPWGYFIGIGAAASWAFANVFVTTFFINSLQQVAQSMHTGHIAVADLVIAVPAWFSNVFVVVGRLWAYSRLPGKSVRDAGRWLSRLRLGSSPSIWRSSSRAIGRSFAECCTRTCLAGSRCRVVG